MIFYHKKKLPPPANIQFTGDETSLTRVKKEKKLILGIVIAEQLSFTQHVEVTTKKCRPVYNRLILYPNQTPNVALQSHKA